MTLLAFFLQASPTPPPAGGTGGDWTMFVMMGLMFVVFWLFFIRPQQKKQKEEKLFRESLKKGDKVITIGGVYGRIVEVEDHTLMVEIDNNVKVKIEKSAIRPLPADNTANK